MEENEIQTAPTVDATKNRKSTNLHIQEYLFAAKNLNGLKTQKSFINWKLQKKKIKGMA